jgi:hypothetical protein
MLGRQSRYWLVTINNPVRPFMDPPLSFQGWRSQPVFACYQLEQGENGTPHFQIYLAFRGAVRGSTVSRALGGNPHLEVRQGTHQQVRFLHAVFCYRRKRKKKKKEIFFWVILTFFFF